MAGFSLAVNRIKKELEDFRLNENDEYGFKVEILDSNLLHLKAQIIGPNESPYCGGRYYLNIKLSDKYPFVAPVVHFITRIWHPNISSVTGLICLDILKTKWLASISLRSVLMSILALLQDPIPSDPQDGQVAKQLLNNKEEFLRTATYWKLFFATSYTPEDRLREYPTYEHKLMEFKNNPIVKAKNKSDSDLVSILSNNEWNMELSLRSIL